MKWLAPLTAAVVAVSLGFASGWLASGSHKAAAPTRVVRKVAATESVYIRNLSPHYFSDKSIRQDIPAWTLAANRDFAPVWRTPHVKIVLLGRKQAVPAGGILATFKQKGPITGALAFHGSFQGNPYMVVYAGVSQYYGYPISEDFTHELFEMLADHFVSGFNIGYLTPYYYVGQQQVSMPRFVPWFNEACDPVEKYGYKINGVLISDFITPNWFNDPISNRAGGFDHMGLVQYPYQILKGGYAQYVLDGQDYPVENFKGAGKDAAGFLKGERLDRAE